MLLTKLKITMAGLFLVALVIGAAEEQPPLEKPLQAPPKKPPHEKNVTDKPTDARSAFDQKLAQEKKFVIVGRVMSADGKKPLEGVEVTAFAGYATLFPAGETKTNRDGKFRLIFFTPRFRGSCAVVHARKPGWCAWTYGWPANF
ncbi:MAG TPA: carboxypeptidase-like regulatory domain-containing protein, partial [Gemmataceae bacterium]|nr:carboxypeptidase-like regulatory domain-containing protein [Gemmataceae bacterium]